MIHLVTGGSASGKSAWAEQQVLALGEDFARFYIATMKPWDAEMKAKIIRHQIMRQEKCFTTIERYTDLEHLKLPERQPAAPAVILLECMSNLAANEIYDRGGSSREVCDRIMTGICHLQNQAEHIIVVTNEVFSDGGCYSEETIAYIKTLGLINAGLGRQADQVTEVVLGLPVAVKNLKKGGG